MQVVASQLTIQLNRYLAYLRDEKHSPSNTVQAYRRDLEKFFGYAATRDIRSFSQLNEEDVEEYKLYLNAQGLSSSSVSRSLSSLRGLFQYLLAVGLADTNPAKNVHNDKVVRKELNVLTSKEVDSLLSQPDVNDIKGIRDKAMLELLYATGIKVSELIGLDLKDLNLSVSCIHCGEGENERLIPLYPVAMKAVTTYLEKSRMILAASTDENALFVNLSGERLSRQGFWKILKSQHTHHPSWNTPYVTPLLCNAFAGKRCGYTRYPGDPWPQRSFLYTALCSVSEGQDEKQLYEIPSEGIKPWEDFIISFPERITDPAKAFQKNK